MSKNIQYSNFNQGSQKPYSYLILPGLTILFLLFVKATTGIRSDHFFLVGIVNISYFLSPYTRRLITALGIYCLLDNLRFHEGMAKLCFSQC